MVVRVGLDINSVRKEVLYNPPIVFRITVKLVTLIKMKPTLKYGKANTCLTYFLLRMACNKAMSYHHYCQFCFSKCHEKGPEDGLKLTGTRQLLLYADYANFIMRKEKHSFISR